MIFEGLTEDGKARLSDGRQVEERDVWPLDVGESLTERLALGHVNGLEEFALRLDSPAPGRAARGRRPGLLPRRPHPPVPAPAVRQPSGPLASGPGALAAWPTRWGWARPSRPASMLESPAAHGTRAERTLVVAPETLTVQWLGELWRKYHQVFVLLDEKRLLDVERDYGQRLQPVRRLPPAWCSASRPSRSDPALSEQADGGRGRPADRRRGAPPAPPAGPPGQPGLPGVAAHRGPCNRHVLLLTATPLEEDAHGFLAPACSCLRPDEFPEDSWMPPNV